MRDRDTGQVSARVIDTNDAPAHGARPRGRLALRLRVRGGQAHTNGIESFWAGLKLAYHGTFRCISPKHLHPQDTEDIMRETVARAWSGGD